jgi:hypothetical protein
MANAYDYHLLTDEMFKNIGGILTFNMMISPVYPVHYFVGKNLKLWPVPLFLSSQD